MPFRRSPWLRGLSALGNLDKILPEDAAVLMACRFSFYTLLSEWWADSEITLSRTSTSGENLLTLAAAAGCRPICETLIKRGMQVDMPPRSGRSGSALAAAAFKGHINVVKFLVQQGADINLPLQHGLFGSALAAAASRGSIEIVRFLVEQGADINLQLPGKYSLDNALEAAVVGEKSEVVKLLAKQGATIRRQRWKAVQSKRYWVDRSARARIAEVLQRYAAIVGD